MPRIRKTYSLRTIFNINCTFNNKLFGKNSCKTYR